MLMRQSLQSLKQSHKPEDLWRHASLGNSYAEKIATCLQCSRAKKQYRCEIQDYMIFGQDQSKTILPLPRATWASEPCRVFDTLVDLFIPWGTCHLQWAAQINMRTQHSSTMLFQISRCSRCPFKESLLWISEYCEHAFFNIITHHTSHFTTSPALSYKKKKNLFHSFGFSYLRIVLAWQLLPSASAFFLFCCK